MYTAPSKGHGGVSENDGYLLGVPLVRILAGWGLYWGPPHYGNYLLQGFFSNSVGFRVYLRPQKTFRRRISY